MSLPDPKEFTSMPRLCMVQSGIQCYVSEQDSKVTKIRLPITPTTTLRIRLKTSTTDQLGNGVNVYVGRTDSPLCPVGAGLDYMTARGSEPGPLFRFSDGSPLTNPSSHS